MGNTVLIWSVQRKSVPLYAWHTLINFYLNWKELDRLRFLLEGDALAGGAGRAEDVFIGFTYQARPKWVVSKNQILWSGQPRSECP